VNGLLILIDASVLMMLSHLQRFRSVERDGKMVLSRE